MAVTQYVGARYVPVFADPLDWSNTREYEPLTIVLHNSNSYTSRQAVPTGIDISNEDYWALTGNFNAQIQGMQQQIDAINSALTPISTNVEKITTDFETYKQWWRRNALALRNNMYQCGKTYIQASGRGELTYADGTGANQAIGTISCSTFVGCIIRGIPYSDYKAADANTLSRSNMLYNFGYRPCDSIPAVGATAQDIYNFANELGVTYVPTDLDEIIPGSIVFNGTSTAAINHCSIALGTFSNSGNLIVMQATSDSTVNNHVGCSGLSTLPVACALLPFEVTSEIKGETKHCMLLTNSMQKQACGGELYMIDFWFSAKPNTLVSIGAIQFTVNNEGLSHIVVPMIHTGSNFNTNVSNITGPDWFFGGFYEPGGDYDVTWYGTGADFLTRYKAMMGSNLYPNNIIAINGRASTSDESSLWSLSINNIANSNAVVMFGFNASATPAMICASGSQSSLPAEFIDVTGWRA